MTEHYQRYSSDVEEWGITFFFNTDAMGGEY